MKVQKHEILPFALRYKQSQERKLQAFRTYLKHRKQKNNEG